MHVIIVILLSEAAPLSVTLPAPGCSSGQEAAFPAPAARGNHLNEGELISTGVPVGEVSGCFPFLKVCGNKPTLLKLLRKPVRQASSHFISIQNW